MLAHLKNMKSQDWAAVGDKLILQNVFQKTSVFCMEMEILCNVLDFERKNWAQVLLRSRFTNSCWTMMDVFKYPNPKYLQQFKVCSLFLCFISMSSSSLLVSSPANSQTWGNNVLSRFSWLLEFLSFWEINLEKAFQFSKWPILTEWFPALFHSTLSPFSQGRHKIRPVTLFTS